MYTHFYKSPVAASDIDNFIHKLVVKQTKPSDVDNFLCKVLCNEPNFGLPVLENGTVLDYENFMACTFAGSYQQKLVVIMDKDHCDPKQTRDLFYTLFNENLENDRTPVATAKLANHRRLSFFSVISEQVEDVIFAD